MVANNILIIALLAPVISALAICLIDNEQDKVNKNSTHVALWTSGFVFALSLMSFLDASQVYIPGYAEHFIDLAFSFSKYFSFERIPSVFITLTTFIFFISLVVSLYEINENRKLFSILVLILESICIALFSTTNIVIFYVCFEAILIPMYLIIGVNGHNFTVSRKFFVCLLIGSMFLLGGVIYMLSITDMANINSLANYQFSYKQSIVLFFLLFTGLAFKSAVFPMHIWLPDSHTLAPTCASIILAGVFVKIGCYGLLTILLKILPQACIDFADLVCALTTCGIIYAAGVAFLQTNFKRLIAYTSIAHIGVIVIGIFSFSSTGLSGAIFQMISHSLTASGLFIIANIIKTRFNSDDLSISGISNALPQLLPIAFPIFLSGISFPFTSNFIGGLSILISIFYTRSIISFFILCAEFIECFYFIRVVKNMFFGPAKTTLISVKGLTLIEYYLIASISFLIILLGICSEIVTTYILPSVKYYL